MKTPNWSMWSRVVGVGVGGVTAMPLWQLGREITAVLAGLALAVIAGVVFRAFTDHAWLAGVVRAEPVDEDGSSERPVWTPQQMLHDLSPYAPVARVQEFEAAHLTERQQRIALLTRESGRRAAGLLVRWQVVRDGRHGEVEVVASGCTEPRARQIAAACGGHPRRVETDEPIDALDRRPA